MGSRMLNHKLHQPALKIFPQILLPGVPFSGNLFNLKYAEAYAIRVKLGHAILVVRSEPTNGRPPGLSYLASHKKATIAVPR
jgi:hypothetical protein